MASVRAVIWKDGQILLLQRSAAGTRPGQWCLPGGRVWNGETAPAALARETWEETGLRIEVGKELGTWRACSYFLCALSAEPGELVLAPKESQAACWVAPAALESVGEIMDYHLIRPLLAGIESV